MMPDLNRVIAGLRCRDLLLVLTDYVDGELSAREVGQVDAHLRGCGHCEKFGGEYGALVGELQSCLNPPTVDSDVRARLANRIEAVWASESD
jgi:anti-sigma factor RsiW